MAIYTITEIIYDEEGYVVTTINNQLIDRCDAINTFQVRRDMLLNTIDCKVLVDTFEKDTTKDISKVKVMNKNCCEIELTLYMISFNILEVIYDEEGYMVTTINNQFNSRCDAINTFQTRRDMLLNTKDCKVLVDTFDSEKDTSKFTLINSDGCEIDLTLYITQSK